MKSHELKKVSGKGGGGNVKSIEKKSLKKSVEMGENVKSIERK